MIDKERKKIKRQIEILNRALRTTKDIKEKKEIEFKISRLSKILDNR